MTMSTQTIFAILHVIAIVIGIGAATAADLLILSRAIFKPVDGKLVDMVGFLSRLVTFGLILLWLSGAGLAYVIWSHNPLFITNQKFWAKLAIVAVLTINAVAIHAFILPKLHRLVGFRLFAQLSFGEQAGFILSASLSGISWYLPLVLGLAREWSYVVPLETVLLLYAFLLSLTCCAMACLVVMAIGREPAPRYRAAA